MNDELEPSPDLNPDPLLDPWVLMTLIYPGLLTALLASMSLPLFFALLLGILASYVALKIRNWIKHRLPPWAVQSWGSWTISPKRLYPGDDPNVPPALREDA